jgi:hypothetical protein
MAPDLAGVARLGYFGGMISFGNQIIALAKENSIKQFFTNIAQDIDAYQSSA